MKITCPHCGSVFEGVHLGRPGLNMPVKKINDALISEKTITGASRKLGCSRAYIYELIKSGVIKKPKKNLKISEA